MSKIQRLNLELKALDEENERMKNEISENNSDDFEFNQDTTLEYSEEYRSPGWDRYKKNKILKWKK